MRTFIVLLRGINVSGQKIIKMADLRNLFERSGFSEVQTYIQSGNVIFQSDNQDISELEIVIHDIIEKHYDFDVNCIVLKIEELTHVLSHNPYLKGDEKNRDHISFTFLSEIPNSANVKTLDQVDLNEEAYTLDGKYMYGYAPNGFARAKLTNNLIERKLKVRATSRNLKTIRKLLELSTTK